MTFYNAKTRERTWSYGRVVIKLGIHWDANALGPAALTLLDIYTEGGVDF